jgi:hypothetical protein
MSQANEGHPRLLADVWSESHHASIDVLTNTVGGGRHCAMTDAVFHACNACMHVSSCEVRALGGDPTAAMLKGSTPWGEGACTNLHNSTS